MKQFSEQEIIRRKKIDENENNGIKSYLKKQHISHSIKKILDDFESYSKDDLENQIFNVST